MEIHVRYLAVRDTMSTIQENEEVVDVLCRGRSAGQSEKAGENATHADDESPRPNQL
ncbi:hypothetical protein [Rhizobium sp. BT-226]|uniref:hypothetical protein n=1 Tax=Rhizobium sp. BT-226 TaxID=2986922 RepID=UPI0021F7953F|nr:hypothetical protein [Rhizobium sp. BT-226]MCW0019087.1 hypothetical protein [Rhizobium sp. BT-226]